MGVTYTAGMTKGGEDIKEGVMKINFVGKHNRTNSNID